MYCKALSLGYVQFQGRYCPFYSKILVLTLLALGVRGCYRILHIGSYMHIYSNQILFKEYEKANEGEGVLMNVIFS